SALLSLASPANAQGETLGVSQGVAGLGRIIGPLAAGSIYAVGGPGAPFVAGGILVLVAALVALPALPGAHRAADQELAPEQAKAAEERITRQPAHVEYSTSSGVK